MTATDETSSIGLRSERGPILVAIMLSTSLIALDSTIIATAVLSITDQLGGFAQFPWLFSIYLLAQAVTVPIYGKLADMLGRKPVMLFGIGVFALGSLLCGLATSMIGLIVFRAVQGIGAGAVSPMSMTIAGDIYTVRERAKVQAYLASVWAASSVLGPLLGGVFSEYVSWRWIFLINLPLAAVAAWMILRKFTECTPRQSHRIDYAGAGLLTLGAGALILALLEGGQAWAWTAPASLALFVGGTVVLAAFALVERRAANPILPLWVFTRRIVVASSLASLLVGAILLGLTSYVPTFAQGVLGSGALIAGLTVGALTLGWPVSASQAGKVYLRIGFRATGVIGAVLAVAGAASLLLVDAHSSLLCLAIGCFVIGMGMGLVASPTLIAAQASAEWSERGVVTATNMFARSLGSAVGVAVFGALVNARLGKVEHPAAAALAPAVHLVFVGVAAMAVVLVGAAAVMPRRSDGNSENSVENPSAEPNGIVRQ
ncbi:MDR family MFS transporter [Nocardia sp. CDC153]|uniref:MDR family MFS transporter n=1 Tax=Nocardia sp. CDC153 TaxID=3112167 RepID=UPI002DC01F29|nr:MDR family MFS transporter [Nocardia sp. CDC153]MEC3951962.1 MDR family MFS transporter [Nocardia sp. CDC153]